MGFFLPVAKTLRRSKYFLVLFVSLSVLAWIATFSGETVKSAPAFPASPQTLVKADIVKHGLNTAPPDRLTTPLQEVECPQESPLLQGAVKLSFESSLTLKDVEGENKGVTEGEYKPSDCTARQSVAVLIPHRSRERHLLYLLNHLHPFLQRQQLHYAIYVIQQAGDATFNRAKLLNVGYLEALKDYSWDCFIFHDVDLVPENDHNLYVCDKQPKHLVVGRNATGYKLRYKGYFGGVTAMTRDQFHRVNGFSNTYWGWGGEDDDLRIRVELQKMKIVRPPADIARYTMVFHKRDSGNEINKDRMRLLGRTALVWKKDGLNSCSYETVLLERQPLYVNVTVDIVPQVLKKCAEFIEEHGIVDGIYRLSGVTSNIQRLRQEFCSEACPDLTKEVYLQDIHCVGSLCKLFFRELPNPLLTYELYSKFTEVVSVQGDHERLLHIQGVIKELPTPHFRTLEYLTKHLAHLATLSTQTNMHTRNLALVWAPNLLRSKDIEASCNNGDMAFQEVRIQQSVVEFILNHTEEIFSNSVQIKPKEGVTCGEKYATLPISGQCGPMKLMSLEEAQARSLSPDHPVHKERQRENSLPNASTATLYHTVIDVSDSKRKFSGKSKKWKSIFNLGRSVESKGKLSRNGSVFIRAQGTEKAALRPSRSMESMCSLPTDNDGSGHKASGSSSTSVPDVKSRTLGSDSLFDLSEHDANWEFKGTRAGGATGGWSSSADQKESPEASAPPQKTLPEQLKVFKGDDLSGYKPTSPKSRRMLYSGSSHNSSSRPSFPGSFFPLESSPRHQRRAVNISEPFAVSVPLRVSAVISSNSTPCRAHVKDKAASLKPCKESSEHSGNSGRSNTFPQVEPKKQEGAEKKKPEGPPSRVLPRDASKEVLQRGQGEVNTSELEPASCVNGRETAPSPGEEGHSQQTALQLDEGSSRGKELSDPHPELKITEPEADLLAETFKPVFSSESTCQGRKLTMDIKSKQSRSSPSLSLLFRDQPSCPPLSDHVTSPTGSDSVHKQPSESDISFSRSNNTAKLHLNIKPFDKDDTKPGRLPLTESRLDKVTNPLTAEDPPSAVIPSGADDTHKDLKKLEIPQGDKKSEDADAAKKSAIPAVEVIQRLSVCLEARRAALELPNLHHDEGCGGIPEELDLVEPWEDFSSTKQWVTSPLHSPDVEEFFKQLSPFGSSPIASPPVDNNKQSLIKSTEQSSGSIPPTCSSGPETKGASGMGVSRGITAQPHSGKGSATRQKNTASSQRFYRQMSYEAEKRAENCFSKRRPYSLNLDLGHRCIRDISNQQDRNSSEFSSGQSGLLTSSESVNNRLPSELDLFLSDRQAPLRRNSAPVSVSSVRTAFMIKTCQAKAVPVVPPKVQYSQIPASRREKDADAAKERPKTPAEKSSAPPPPAMSDLREELENKEPAPPAHQRHPQGAEAAKAKCAGELPVITRRHAPSLEVFVDCPRPGRGNVSQRPSFRNRQRPQSLILLSPPFPIMDHPPTGDDGKPPPSLRGPSDASAAGVFSREAADGLRAPEGIGLQNKMTIPKSGQRLETSTSCFYQPQRRSMIFDSRSHRQIE